MAARDYLQGKTLEKYCVTLSREIWLPLRIERYSLENIPIEKSLLHHYIRNARPGDEFFSLDKFDDIAKRLTFYYSVLKITLKGARKNP